MTTTAQNSYYPQVDKSVDPKVTVHLQRVYPALDNHDKAIRALNAKVTALQKTTSATTVTKTISSSTSSSGGGGSTTSFPGLGYVNPQPGITAYTIQQSDSGAEVQFSDAAAIAVTLDTALNSPFFSFLTNLGPSLVTLTPNGGSTINGNATFDLPKNSLCVVVLSNLLWYATAIQIVPVNTPAVAHEFWTAYNDTTGAFTAAQPDFGDLTGTLQAGQLLDGTSASLGGAAMIAGQTISITVAITGAATGMVAATSPETYPGDGFVWDAYVSAADTVTVRLTATLAGTPTASLYDVRVLP
jgi:hypothetical protein